MIVIVLLLIGGFIAQVAVGYWLLYRSMDRTEDHAPLHMGARFFETDQSIVWYMTLHQYRQCATVWTTFRSRPERSDYGWAVDMETFSARVPLSLRSSVMAPLAEKFPYSPWESEGGLAPRQDVETVVRLRACGWPCYSLIGTEIGKPPQDENWKDHDTLWRTSGAFVVEREGERHLVPYRPLLLGTLVNTICFAALLTIPFAAALGGRRLWRYERGRCPRCAYDLQQDFKSGCPECGWGRPDAQFSPAN
jgi:hypothetical protein